MLFLVNCGLVALLFSLHRFVLYLYLRALVWWFVCIVFVLLCFRCFVLSFTFVVYLCFNSVVICMLI